MEGLTFDELRTWFPDLSPSEQELVISIRDEKIKGIPDRTIPWSHGKTPEEQRSAGRRAFLSQKEPFSLIRIGDFETGLLGALYFPCGNSDPNYDVMFRRAGYSAQAFFLRTPFIEAVRKSALVGLHEQWEGQRQSTAAMLAMLDCEVPLSRGVEVHLPYYLLADGTLFSWLSGKRVLLVGGLAPQLEEAWKKMEFHKAHERFGPSSHVKIVGSVPTSTREEGGSWKDFYRAKFEISKRSDFDVALVACGAVAKPLTYEIYKMGKTAVDVGFVFDALAGERLDAWSQRDVFRDLEPVKPTW